MKPKILILALFAVFLFACQTSNDDLIETESISTELEKSNQKIKTVTIPFKANFSVWDESDLTDIRCGEFPNFFLTMNGFGKATHLGKSFVNATFCCDVLTGAYQNTLYTFVAANGDELYGETITGQIIPNNDVNSSYYQTKFNDTIVITGGTGKFQGASGMVMSNAFVHDGAEEWRTDFFPEGTINLKKGRK